MAVLDDQLQWSAQYQVAQSDRTSRLQGDRIALPQSALEALLAAAPIISVNQPPARPYTSTFDPFNPYTFAAEQEARQHLADRQQQLPHPLTFRLVNPQNGRVVFAGIREFSAKENEVGLSRVLQDALGLDDASSAVTREQTPNGDADTVDAGVLKPQIITVHAKRLPKGTYVRLRPLEAGYDPEDWKSLLERYLRDNFTTLTNGEILSVRSGRREKFQFLVDKLEPEGEGICVVDTDLEVDIEALNEEQARETLSRKLAKGHRALGAAEESSAGGILDFATPQNGQVIAGEYVDYEIKSWPKEGQSIEFDVEIDQEDAELDLFVIPFSARQRSKPRDDEHVFGDFSSQPSKRIRLSGTNVELEDAETLCVSVHAYQDTTGSGAQSRPIPYTLRARIAVPETSTAENDDTPTAGLDEVICKNCRQSIPQRTLSLHEAFCYRNNISCPQCHHVFLKNSPAWRFHWHCPHDTAHGNTPLSRTKHDSIYHPPTPYPCPNCDFLASSLPSLATHRVSLCPGKEILCQFCHLIVPQQGPDDPSFSDPEVIMSGLTPHELADGARTTECHLCDKIVRLRDMKTHLAIHDRDRVARPKPRVCANKMCGRTVRGAESEGVQLGLCDECFGPLYITSYDPEGKALRRRVERRLLTQLMAGCGQVWCNNRGFCRTGKRNQSANNGQGGVSNATGVMTAKDALPLVKPVLDTLRITGGSSGGGGGGGGVGDECALFFCVDEASQHGRTLAHELAQQGEYDLEWWIKALKETRAVGGGGGGGGGEEVGSRVQRAREWLQGRAPRVGEVATRNS